MPSSTSRIFCEKKEKNEKTPLLSDRSSYHHVLVPFGQDEDKNQKTLPHDLVVQIINFLDFIDVIALALSDKSLYTCIMQSPYYLSEEVVDTLSNRTILTSTYQVNFISAVLNYNIFHDDNALQTNVDEYKAQIQIIKRIDPKYLPGNCCCEDGMIATIPYCCLAGSATGTMVCGMNPSCCWGGTSLCDTSSGLNCIDMSDPSCCMCPKDFSCCPLTMNGVKCCSTLGCFNKTALVFGLTPCLLPLAVGLLCAVGTGIKYAIGYLLAENAPRGNAATIAEKRKAVQHLIESKLSIFRFYHHPLCHHVSEETVADKQRFNRYYEDVLSNRLALTESGITGFRNR